MAKAYFFSDAHLGLGTPEEDRAKENRVLSFLDMVAADGTQLYIVGDLFDAWIEYRTVIPKGHHRLLTRLEDIARSGIETHYLVGNHDFWTLDFFTKELGIHTHPDAYETNIDGKRFYIHHGDGFATNDTGYRILKKILRNPLCVWLYRWVHPDIGYGIARSSSSNSRQYTSGKDYGEADGMIAAATQKISDGFDVVVMGHRHQPLYKKIEQGTKHGLYVNLGDWMQFNTYAVAENGKVELRTWEK